MISIIIPHYNHHTVLQKALQSIAAQTYQDIQVIIVDDGSDQPLDHMALTNIIPTVQIITQKNAGAPAARNAGREHAVGEYLIFWDADVIAESHFLATLRETIEKNTEAAFAYSNFIFGKKTFHLFPFSAEKLFQENYIHSTALIRAEQAPEWDITLKRFQDWDYWLQVVKAGGRGVWVDEVLFRVETKGGTMSEWLPRFAYHAPFRWLPGICKKVRAYEEAKQVVMEKYGRK